MSFTTMPPYQGLASLFLSLLLLSTTSCKTLDSMTEDAKDKMHENKELLVGSAVGGATGAAIGGLLGKEKGAIIGGAVGLVSGALIGNYYAKRERDRTQTTASVGYRPEQGNLLTISDMVVSPSVAKQGGSVKINSKYTILRPDEGKATIKETREIRWNGKLLDTQIADIQMEQGVQNVTWEYPIAREAKAGNYKIVTTVAIDDTKAAATTTFAIK